MNFELIFLSDNYGTKSIDEPVGIDNIVFGLKQKSDGNSRDEEYLGDDKNTLSFYSKRNHQLKQLLYYYQKFGFEAKVHIKISISDTESLTYALDFENAVTDDYTYFKCIAVLISDYQVLKKRKDVKVDLTSNTDINGNYIEPLVPVNMLVKAKPVIQKSIWEQASSYSATLISDGNFGTTYHHINDCLQQTQYDLEDSYVPFVAKETSFGSYFSESSLLYFTAKNNIKNLKVSIKEYYLSMQTSVSNGGNGYVNFELTVRKGVDFESSEKFILSAKTLDENKGYTLTNDFDLVIDSLNRGESIWIYSYFKVRQSANINILGNPKFTCKVNINTKNITLIGESTAYNTISPSFRLVDVISQVVKSTTGLTVNTLKLQAVDEFYNTRLINGNLLRNITDKAFSVSLEDIMSSLWGEAKIDYEIQDNGVVFFGFNNDFYQNIECAVSTDVQFKEMNKATNKKYAVNEFWIRYKNYQALKENEEAGSADTVHGESRWVFYNQSVENKRAIEIDWTRDVFLIDEARKKAFEITTNTASQEDDTIFALDTEPTLYDLQITETTILQHNYDTTTSLLSVRNNGEINFILLGVKTGTDFIILSPDDNAGTYTVSSVVANEIKLSRTSSGSINTSNDGLRSTKYTYQIKKTDVPFTLYTNKGITNINGLNAPDNYGNLRFSLKRSIINYWQNDLATSNMWWKDTTLKNSWYKNNGDCEFTYNGITTNEKQEFIPESPVISSFIYEDVIIANVSFKKFLQWRASLRVNRGYIRTIENNNRVLKLFVTDFKYNPKEKTITITGEEKYQPEKMTISTANNRILINNEYTLNRLKYEVKNTNLICIYDSKRQLLYNPVYWNTISINGSLAENLTELKSRLDLLT